MGVALSGGGVRGLAHLGVLKALEERAIYPDIISGVSVGSLIAVFYADGHSVDDMFRVASSIGFTSITGKSVLSFKNGFFSQTGLRNLLDKHLRAKTFEELKKPVRIVASDIEHGRIKVFSEGAIIPAVMASCSVPVVFPPVNIEGHHYVDGGLLMNFPVSVIRKECERIIGVNVSPVGSMRYEESLRYVIGQTMSYMVGANTSAERRLCDYLIEPSKITGHSIFDFKHLEEMYKHGYEFASAYLDDNKESLHADFHGKKTVWWREMIANWGLSLKPKQEK